jgi:hypothetical protein
MFIATTFYRLLRSRLNVTNRIAPGCEEKDLPKLRSSRDNNQLLLSECWFPFRQSRCCPFLRLLAGASALLCLGGRPAPAQNTDWQRAISWMGKNPLEHENARRGAAVSQQSSAYCHGKNADGGSEAPNLIRSLLARHDKGGDLIGSASSTPGRRRPCRRATNLERVLFLALGVN